MYKLGKSYKFKVKQPWPTTTYTISSRRAGKAIKGKLALSYSMLSTDTWGNYRILTCYGTASYTARPR